MRLLAYRDAFLESFIDDGELEKLTERTTKDPALLRRALADVRALGVAVECEEFTSGVCCAGAPIFGDDGEPVAALSVSVPKARFDTEGEAIIEALRDVAEQAGAQLRRATGRRRGDTRPMGYSAASNEPRVDQDESVERAVDPARDAVACPGPAPRTRRGSSTPTSPRRGR